MRFKQISIAFLLSFSLLAFGQGRGPGGGQGRGQGQGLRLRDGSCQGKNLAQTQQCRQLHRGPLNDAARQSASWKMLQQRTGLSADALEKHYNENGFRSYGQFGMAMLVSHGNSKVDSSRVMSSMRSGKSLQQALQEQGMTREEARLQISSAQQQMFQADTTVAASK